MFFSYLLRTTLIPKVLLMQRLPLRSNGKLFFARYLFRYQWSHSKGFFLCMCVSLTNGIKIVVLLIFFFFNFILYLFFIYFILCWPKVFLRYNNKFCNICCVSPWQWYSRFCLECNYFSNWNSDEIFPYESNASRFWLPKS